MAFVFLRRLFWPGSVACLASLAAARADDPVDRVGKTANEWVKTRAETVRLETEWAGQRGLMESMITALGERARILEEKAAHARARTAEERAELDTLEQRNVAASAGLTASAGRLDTVAAALIELRPLLPPRLSAALELPYRSLTDPALPVGDRMQHTMTILNRCLQFNRTVSTSEEAITTGPGAAPKSLEVIYWGLSHGYALDRAAGQAWLGSPGPGGWRWEPRPEAVAGVTRLLAIAADKADPDFVVVPAPAGSTTP